MYYRGRDSIVTARIRSIAKVMFSAFLSFCPRGGGGGGVKIEKCSECHGKPKKCIKIFSDYTPFDQGGGGSILNVYFSKSIYHI